MSDSMITAVGAVIVAIITLLGTIYSSKKTAEKAANSAAEQVGALTVYRIDQLEKKVDKHNSVIERTYRVEARCDVLEQRLDDAEGK